MLAANPKDFALRLATRTRISGMLFVGVNSLAMINIPASSLIYNRKDEDRARYGFMNTVRCNGGRPQHGLPNSVPSDLTTPGIRLQHLVRRFHHPFEPMPVAELHLCCLCRLSTDRSADTPSCPDQSDHESSDTSICMSCPDIHRTIRRHADFASAILESHWVRRCVPWFPKGTGINQEKDIVELLLATKARRTHDGLADSYSTCPRGTCTYVPFGPRNNFANQVQAEDNVPWSLFPGLKPSNRTISRFCIKDHVSPQSATCGLVKSMFFPQMAVSNVVVWYRDRLMK